MKERKIYRERGREKDRVKDKEMKREKNKEERSQKKGETKGAGLFVKKMKRAKRNGVENEFTEKNFKKSKGKKN